MLHLWKKSYSILKDPLLGLQATVEGDGFLAAMYRSILENFNPVNFVLPSLDTRECLPMAVKPNYSTYFWIGNTSLKKPESGTV